MVLAAAENKDYSVIKKLYRKSFPKNERFPFFILKRKAVGKKAEMLQLKKTINLSGLYI